MFCDQVLEQIDAIAASDHVADGAVATHLARCRACTAALEQAYRLERLLAARPVVSPPPQFAARVLMRMRRERWRREQVFDTAFNVSLAVALVALVIAVWMAADRSGFSAVTGSSWLLVRQALTEWATRAAPSLGLYAAAAALIGGALLLWWWAERT